MIMVLKYTKMCSLKEENELFVFTVSKAAMHS